MGVINGNLYQIAYRLINTNSNNTPNFDNGLKLIHIIAASAAAAWVAAKAIISVGGGQTLQLESITQEAQVTTIGQ